MNWREWAKRTVGLDRAVGFTLIARLVQIMSSVGTVLLIVRFLSSVAQGYYYTLLSLAALQTIFELGFSFVILQLAAHEAPHLAIHPDGSIEGDAVAHARLASALQLTVRWYLRAAIALAVLLLPLGIAFFRHKSAPNVQVAWFGPWVAAVIGVSGYFLLTPLYSFLEGCGLVKDVARLRMNQALVALVLSWCTIASGHGLYACAMVNLGVIAAGLAFLGRHRQLLRSLLRYPVGDHAISWLREIWPFQWQIAVSWLCSYFTLQVFTPILFAFRGPQEAGKMGLSISVTTYLPILALSWISTKAAPFGQLVKLGRLKDLEELFFRALRQSLALIVVLAICVFGAVLAVQRISPHFATRMETPWVFGFLLFAAISSFVVQALAVYLRSFKREPYLLLSVVVTSLTLIGVLAVTPRWGDRGVALVYSLLTGVVAPLWAASVLRAQKRENSRESDAVLPVEEIVAGLAAYPVDRQRSHE